MTCDFPFDLQRTHKDQWPLEVKLEVTDIWFTCEKWSSCNYAFFEPTYDLLFTSKLIFFNLCPFGQLWGQIQGRRNSSIWLIFLHIFWTLESFYSKFQENRTGGHFFWEVCDILSPLPLNFFNTNNNQRVYVSCCVSLLTY